MLEAMVALAIVALVCVGVLGAHGAAIRADVTAVNRLPLAELAVERLAAVDIDGGNLGRLPDSLVRGEFTPPYTGVSWTIDVYPVTRTAGLFDIVVQVHDGSGTFTLRTRRYRTPVVTPGRI